MQMVGLFVSYHSFRLKPPKPTSLDQAEYVSESNSNHVDFWQHADAPKLLLGIIPDQNPHENPRFTVFAKLA